MENTQNYDYLGITLSFICGVHCLVTPLLIIAAPSLGEKLHSVWVHSGLIFFMALAFYQSIFRHFRFHRSKAVLLNGLIGLSLILISYFNEILSDSHGHHHTHSSEVHADENYIVFIALLGATFLIISHVLNIRKCHCLRGNREC